MDVSHDLLRYIAWTLIADVELAAFHSITDNALKPVQMHLREPVQGSLQGRGDRPEDRTERAAGAHALALAVNDAEHVEIGFQALARFLPHGLLHARIDPVGRICKHSEGDGVLGVEIMIEARLADADLVGDVLETEAVKAARLN